MVHRNVVWRAMTGYDLSAVRQIADRIYPAFYEAPEVLAERQQLYRDGCYLLEIGDRPVGYVLSHPWRAGSPPELNALLGEIPAAADTYYLHDLAILPVARRIGAASHIVSALAKHAQAQGYPTMTLVAVGGSLDFWKKHGFAVAEASAAADKLGSYAGEARLMVRPLA